MRRISLLLPGWILVLALSSGTVLAEEPAPDEVIELPEVVVEAPRIHATKSVEGPAETVTPLLREARAFDVPAAVTVEDGAYLRQRKMVRSLPDALLRLPSVLVQKTAAMQSSPFIRGFTGYRNLMLIDGVRFNTSAFRAGPNQMWSTIDPYTIGQLELTRGPLSVLYGSDAVGGTVNVIPQRRESFEPGWHLNGLVSGRVASAERAVASRFQVEGNHGRIGFLGGGSYKSYGDIESGGGRLRETGGITEIDGDWRFDIPFSDALRLILAYQHVGQEDAPRTHKTIWSVPFRGTVRGSELRRNHDQQRDLAYARLVYESVWGPLREASIGVSWQRQFDERDRLRTRERRDFTGYELQQMGVQARARFATAIGEVTVGADYYRDEADTWRRDYKNGLLDKVRIQGAFGDDSRYDLLGAYVQDEITFGRFDLILGARFTYAAAEANRVEDPVNPGEVIRVANDWTNVVGSIRGVYHVTSEVNLYGGVSQAFRAPTLYDLTSFDVTGFVERPNPNLEPENFVTFEIGTKVERQNLSAYAALWYTRLDGTIVRSPTGEVVEDTAVVRADNIGDGWAWGWETEVAARVHRNWLAFGNMSWMNGRVDELDSATGRTVFSPLSRLKPFTLLAGVRYEPPTSPGWAQLEVMFSDREDRLSLRDKTDTTRIPPGGTPGWTTLNLRGGYDVGRHVRVGAAIENLLDVNYRIHGSGLNEPGLNVVLTLDLEF